VGIFDSSRKAALSLCGFVVALVISGCGGGDSNESSPLQNLYSFGGTATDAMEPDAALILGRDGNFYGTTTGGGIDAELSMDGTVSGYGTVFKITPAGEETVLHTFYSDPSDGFWPKALIQGSDGNLYGTTSAGALGCGTVFKLTLDGVETILHAFTGVSDGIHPTEGCGPLRGLISIRRLRLTGPPLTPCLRRRSPAECDITHPSPRN
jgi:uncharacterized repeat protein (TIGR03803 family)